MFRRKNILVGFVVTLLCANISSLSAMMRKRLVGISCDFSSADAKQIPSVRVTSIAGVPSSIGVDPYAEPGTFQALNASLPVEVTVRYTDTNKEYIIVIDEAAKADKLPCRGATPTTIEAKISPRSGTFTQKSKVCLSLSETIAANSVVRSGDFNGVALFLKPRAEIKATAASYNPTSQSSLPFTFGLSAWTTDQAPWTRGTLMSTNDIGQDTRGYDFSLDHVDPVSGEPLGLSIFQGFGGLGGGQVPRMFHASIGHIFNDTDDIVMISRRSGDPALAKFNYSQMIPPRAAFPYAIFWIPRVPSKDDLTIPGHDGIKITLLAKKPKIVTPDYRNFYTPVEDLSTNYKVDIPDGLEELYALLSENMQPAAEEAADILGVTQWQHSGDYPQLSVANHYFMISTVAAERKTYIQKYTVKNDRCIPSNRCIPSPVESSTETAYSDPQGLPSYYNLIIKKDENKEFTVDLYKATLRPPYKKY